MVFVKFGDCLTQACERIDLDLGEKPAVVLVTKMLARLLNVVDVLGLELIWQYKVGISQKRFVCWYNLIAHIYATFVAHYRIEYCGTSLSL